MILAPLALPWNVAAASPSANSALRESAAIAAAYAGLDARATNLYIYVVAPTQFRWIEWNHWQATKHGCTIPEIESVVRNAGREFPRKRDRKKWLVIGRGTGDRQIEVLYLLDDDGTAFVIHAMPLTTRRRRG